MRISGVLLFTRYGLGEGPEALQKELAVKYLTLTLQSGRLPMQLLFYSNGVRLVCKGSPVLDLLRELESRGCELIVCRTCLVEFDLLDQVEVGVVGGMGDILTALQNTSKVVSL